MNDTLIENSKKILLESLLQCTEAQQFLFKRMYSHKNLNASITEAVAQMDPEKIHIAMNQIERTLEKNQLKPTEK